MPKAATAVKVTLTREKDTKNKVRFSSEDPALDTAYLSKDAWQELGSPESISVVIEAA